MKTRVPGQLQSSRSERGQGARLGTTETRRFNLWDQSSISLFLTLATILFLVACAAPKPVAGFTRVTLVAGGTRTPITADASNWTVRDVLRQANVTLNELDRVRPPESVAISDGMTITVTRILQRTETQTQTVPFTQQTVRDASLPAGQSKVLQSGRNGTLVLTYRLTFEDGVQAERALIDDGAFLKRDAVGEFVQQAGRARAITRPLTSLPRWPGR